MPFRAPGLLLIRARPQGNGGLPLTLLYFVSMFWKSSPPTHTRGNSPYKQTEVLHTLKLIVALRWTGQLTSFSHFLSRSALNLGLHGHLLMGHVVYISVSSTAAPPQPAEGRKDRSN